MDLLRAKLPELRYIYHNIKTLKQINEYIDTASFQLIKVLFQIALNRVYSNKNKLKIKTNFLKKIKPYKKKLLMLVNSKSIKIQRKLLKGKMVILIIQIFFSFLPNLKIE